jgi:ABC-type branched-subunit amino acid transport system substrate-binding protein/DNA-binding SARP family transcriptional activator
VEFRVLGPLEVIEAGAPLPLGGPRQRLVLATLILEANRVVPTTRLIDRVWGDEPPDAVRATLFAHISRLRKLLGPGRIQARPPGYILLAERDDIDLLRFLDLVEIARRQSDDRQAVAGLLSEALDLWRGGPLSDLSEFPSLLGSITHLEELRVAALEDRIAADLDLGRHRDLVPLLEDLTSEYPLRERLWSQLMLALYRSGRQGDALNAYLRARNTFAEGLGIEPSPELRRLHEWVLDQDPALELGQPSQPVSGTATAKPAATPEPKRISSRGLTLIVGAALAIAVAAVAWRAWQPAMGLPPGEWRIGLDMPLSGQDAYVGQPVRNAVQMAIDDTNAAGGIDGSVLEVREFDDGADPDRAATNAHSLVADPSTVAMIGPWGSAATFSVIPGTNAAGLLECSPGATHPGLTKPRDGALDLRASHPDAINFLRLPPADDIQAVALASFAYHDLDARFALVVDDTDVGRDIADAFEAEFAKLGGTTVRRALNPGGDTSAILTPLAQESADPPRLVFYGGDPGSGAAVRRGMVDRGWQSIPFLSWDFLLDGSGADPDSYLQRAGTAAAVGSYAAHASLPDHKASFADAYRTRFEGAPDEYAAAGYACVEVITAALRDVATRGPTASTLRELLRAAAVDPDARYETVLGTIGFDANGDAQQQFVTFYRVEASAADGAGDWVILKKQDFGPAR